jgi:sporadic carbohydrate cluster protein (TIGR04323 family)
MKIKKKIFSSGSELFCYPDTLLNKFIPQAWQIFIMKSFISEYNKKISFYTGESHKTYKKMTLLKKKLNENPRLHGFVFFSFLQFCYDKKDNLKIMEECLKKNYTIYLAREKIVISSMKEYKKKKIDFFYFTKTNKNLIKSILENFNY